MYAKLQFNISQQSWAKIVGVETIPLHQDEPTRTEFYFYPHGIMTLRDDGDNIISILRNGKVICTFKTNDPENLTVVFDGIGKSILKVYHTNFVVPNNIRAEACVIDDTLKQDYPRIPLSIPVFIEQKPNFAPTLSLMDTGIWKEHPRSQLNMSADGKLLLYQAAIDDFVEIYLTEEEASNKIRELAASTGKACGPPIKRSKVEDDWNIVYTIDNSSDPSFYSIKPIFISSIIWIKKEQALGEGLADSVVNSFTAAISSSGETTRNQLLEYIKSYSQYFLKYKIFIAPITSLCQCSGSGKSKLSCSLTETNPGFYICCRESKNTGYPAQTNLSDSILSIMRNGSISDTNQELTDVNALSSMCGNLLLLFAGCILTYLRTIIKDVLNGKALAVALTDFAKKFEKSEVIEDIPSKESLAERCATKTVGSVCTFIAQILSNPTKCFTDEEQANEFGAKGSRKRKKFADICSDLAKGFDITPFIFIIDEAAQLPDCQVHVAKEDDPSSKSDQYIKYTGFQILRRALSYLPPEARIFFLGLGTKASVELFTATVKDPSMRRLKRTILFPPIVLRGNFDAWREEYPISELPLSYELLKDPRLFIYLCTLSLPVFASLLFKDVLTVAREKLVNGSRDSPDKEFIYAVWLLCAGLPGEIKSTFASKLINNHMASLLNVSADFRSYRIAYGSNPILALAARDIYEVDKDYLQMFQTLKDCAHLVDIDRGRIAESLAAIALLKVMVRTRPMNDMLPTSNVGSKFEALFNRKNFVLEKDESTSPSTFGQASAQNAPQAPVPVPSEKDSVDTPETATSNSESDSPHCPELFKTLESFANVKTAEAFLETLLGEAAFQQQKSRLDPRILKASVNVAQFMPLNRLVDFAKSIPEPANISELKYVFPLANDFVPDYSRNVLCYQLLAQALIRHYGIIMPRGYFAFDLCIPICLDEMVDGKPVLSWIAIQVKTGHNTSVDEFAQMDGRLHFVRCIRSTQPDHSCDLCTSTAMMEAMFKNQLAIALELKGLTKRAAAWNTLSYNDLALFDNHLAADVGGPSVASERAARYHRRNIRKHAAQILLKKLYPAEFFEEEELHEQAESDQEIEVDVDVDDDDGDFAVKDTEMGEVGEIAELGIDVKDGDEGEDESGFESGRESEFQSDRESVTSFNETSLEKCEAICRRGPLIFPSPCIEHKLHFKDEPFSTVKFVWDDSKDTRRLVKESLNDSESQYKLKPFKPTTIPLHSALTVIIIYGWDCFSANIRELKEAHEIAAELIDQNRVDPFVDMYASEVSLAATEFGHMGPALETSSFFDQLVHGKRNPATNFVPKAADIVTMSNRLAGRRENIPEAPPVQQASTSKSSSLVQPSKEESVQIEFTPEEAEESPRRKSKRNVKRS